MKALENKIDKLVETIEMGLLTKNEAMTELQKMYRNIIEKYEIGSDEYECLIYPLIDATEFAQLL